MLSPPHTRIASPPQFLELDSEVGEGGKGRGSRRGRLGSEAVVEAGLLSPSSPLPAPGSPPSSDHVMQIVKVILLGAPAVGKTSIIQQFVWNEFSDCYVPTTRKQTYFPTVIINEHLYELNLSDVPVISYFPVNSFYEWTDFRFYGLRSATAYVLVYDLSNAETFQYIRTLREQMAESRDMRNVPLLVVGNKQDLVESGPSVSNPTNAVCLMEQGLHVQRLAEQAREKRDIVNIVKKHWKCAYIECSAKYNWRVVAVFKELMRAVDVIKASGQPGLTSGHKDNSPMEMDSNKCSIL